MPLIKKALNHYTAVAADAICYRMDAGHRIACDDEGYYLANPFGTPVARITPEIHEEVLKRRPSHH